jgi:hypothetical protein
MQGFYEQKAKRKVAATKTAAKEVQAFAAEAFRRCSHHGTEMKIGVRPSGRPDAWQVGRLPAILLVFLNS